MDELSGRRMIEMLPRLRRFAYGLCGDPHDADDLVQHTCQRAIDRFDNWRPGTSLENWMFAIARNAYLDLYRSRQVRADHAAAVRATTDGSLDGEGRAEHGVMIGEIVPLLGRMPEDQRTALLLALVEGLSYQEIADIQQVPVGTVTSRIGRARQTLQQALSSEAGTPHQREGGEFDVARRQ